MSTQETNYIDKWESQVKKGVLDYIILLLLQQKEYYGYDLINQIKQTTNYDVAEGTVYPLLNRLKKDGLVESKWVEMTTGIPRKYYTLTPKGIKTIEEMKEVWLQLNFSLQKLMMKK